MEREVQARLMRPDRSGLDPIQLVLAVESIDFEQLVRGERLDQNETYTTFMNDQVTSPEPSAFVLVSDHEFLFDGKPYHVTGQEMTAYINLLLHQRHGKIDLTALDKVGFFAEDMTYQAQNGMLRKLQTATAAISGDSHQTKLTGQASGFGTKLHRIRDDCLVFDERENYAQPENATELQTIQAAAKEIKYVPTQPKTKKAVGEAALDGAAAELVDDFPFNRVDDANLASFLTGKSNDFPTRVRDYTSDWEIKKIINEAFDAKDRPDDFELRLKLVNDQIIEQRTAS